MSEPRSNAALLRQNGCTRTGGEQFFTKIIGNTENFSNFTLGNHDIVFIVSMSKLLNIIDVTKRIGNLFKLPIQLFSVGLIP